MTLLLTDSRRRAMTLSTLACTIMSLTFAVINTVRGLPLMVGLDLFMATVFVANYYYFRRSNNIILAGLIGLSLPMTFSVLATHTLGIAGLIWVYSVPIPTFYLLGTKYGSRFLTFWGLVAGTMVYMTEISGLPSLTIKLELGICYALICVMAYKVEHLRAHNELQIQNLADKAQQANQVKDHFLAHMSHEFRTPLNAIMGFSQILGHRSDLSDETADYIKSIGESGARLNELVDSILNFSRLQAGDTTRRTERFPLSDLLLAAADDVKAEAAAQGLSVRVDTDNYVILSADHSLLRHALVSMLTGAIKNAGGKGQIRLSSCLEDNLYLTVCYTNDENPTCEFENSGESLARAGDLLTNVPGDCSLGLAIVKLIAEAHDGHLLTKDHSGTSACFSISLPDTIYSATEPKAELIGN